MLEDVKQFVNGAACIQNFKDTRRRLRSLKAPEKPMPPVAMNYPSVVLPDYNVVYLTPPVVRPYEVVGRYPSVGDVIHEVTQFYNIRKVDLLSHRRTVHVVRIRHITMYLARELTLRSYPYIGKHLGGKDHTTILSGVRKISKLLALDNPECARLKDEIDLLRIKIAERLLARQAVVTIGFFP